MGEPDASVCIHLQNWQSVGADPLLTPKPIGALILDDLNDYEIQDDDFGGMDGDNDAGDDYDLPFDSEASPEPALLPFHSPSPELGAPADQDDDATPATSASPAAAPKRKPKKPSLKRKAVKSSAPPAKRRKRPAVKAVKSRVLRSVRKPLPEEQPGKPRALTSRGRAVGSRSSRN